MTPRGRLVKRIRRAIRRSLTPIMGTPEKKPRPPWDDQEWSIGLYLGESPFRFAPAEAANPILTRSHVRDVPADFVADPFMVRRNGRWYMMLEVMNRERGKGEIGMATSEDGLAWAYREIVLREPFNLSYPYAFEWNGAVYLIPETYQAKAVRLYRALEFPSRWALDATLLEGQEFVDPSLFRFRDRWWLFVGTGTTAYRADTLHLYWAEELRGPWRAHRRSPVVAGNLHIARPAGRVVVLKDEVVRYTQDCDPYYGLLVRAFRIRDLTPAAYDEEEAPENPVLRAGGEPWNSAGMHHIDPHALADGRWLACVDGWFMRQPPEPSPAPMSQSVHP